MRNLACMKGSYSGSAKVKPCGTTGVRASPAGGGLAVPVIPEMGTIVPTLGTPGKACKNQQVGTPDATVSGPFR